MSTEMLDVLSVLDEQDNPVLGNCTLVLGEVALEFKNGRSVVPAQYAPVVARCERVKIPGYRGPVAPPVPAVPAVSWELPSEPDKVEAAVEYLREQGIGVPIFDPASAPQGVMVTSEVASMESDMTAKEMPIAKINELPDGFEPLTAAGEPRCFARTGSGAQCSNAAVAHSKACGLGAHREQVS